MPTPEPPLGGNPRGTPYLTAAAHLTPEDGSCLMEAVSAAAGLPWSDSPSCTHPLLAHLACLVNDAMSDDGRQQLGGLVPALVAASSDGAASTARASARIATTCTERALRIRSTPLLAHLHHVATAELRHERAATTRPARPVLVRVRRRVFLHGPASRAVEQSVEACRRLPAPERDAALGLLLREALIAVAVECSPHSARPAAGGDPDRQPLTAASSAEAGTSAGPRGSH